jgi:hypothetical protein
VQPGLRLIGHCSPLPCRRRRLSLEPVAEAGYVSEPGTPLRLVHGEVKDNRGPEHKADHCTHPEALYAGGD